MRSLKSGLLTFAAAGFFGVAAVVGCSADGSSDVIEDPNATEPTGDQGAQLPPSSSGSSSSSSSSGSTPKDAGKDATKTDSGKDAGPPPPNPGDPCTKVDQIFKKSCGACGTQEAVCLAGADGGAGTVSDYGACQNEVAGGCIPGTTEDVACGNCGTAKKTCNQYCAWSTGTCTGQPTNSCKPGAYEYTAAGCTTANQYRRRDCQTSCTWTNYGACAQPVNDIVLSVAGGVGAVSSQNFSLSTAKMAPRLPTYGGCPITGSFSTGDYPYEYVEVKNTTAKKATLTIYLTQATTPVIDTVMAAYGTPIQPMDDNARKQCSFGPNDQSSSSDPTGNTNLSILKTVSVNAGASVLVYVSTFFDYDPTAPAESTGTLTLNAKIDALQ